MGKDEPQTGLLLPGRGALRSGVLTGSHLWPLRVQEAVLIGRLEVEESCHSSDTTDSMLRRVNVTSLLQRVELRTY